MSTRSSAPRGVLLAGVGAFVALGSLWLPWYTIKFPDAFRDALGSVGSGAGSAKVTGAGGAGAGAAGDAFAGMFKGLAALLPTEITGKGWQVMSGGDVALAVAACAALLLVLAVSGGAAGVRIDRGIAGRLISAAGLVVAGIAVYHVVSKPGSGAGEFSAMVQVKLGLWVATAGGLAMIVGGALTARPPQAEAFEPVSSPVIEAQPFAAFAPPAAATAATAHDPFAAPVESFAVPAVEMSAAPDPFADPVTEAPAPPPYDPFGEPALAAPSAHDPFAAPDPCAAPDPFATPVEPPAAADAGLADASPVPDWAGFSTPTPEPVPDPEYAEHASVVPQPSVPRPAGVSIPPPGWNGAG